jgi:hypothetical protein
MSCEASRVGVPSEFRTKKNVSRDDARGENQASEGS